MTMDESRSKKLALKLLAAVSAGDVDSIMQSDAAFGDAGNWKPYGDVPKNWDRVNVQTSDPVAALAELLINSIDAILMRKAKERNLEPRGEDAPKSMLEAVEKFFPGVPEGRMARLSPLERTKIAEKSILVGVKRATKARQFPTYTIADFGEGQNPADFSKTLLSLGEANKDGIPFVQGRFNMGSTGSIVFCTKSDIWQGHYKFVLSKRTLPDSDKNWGWTLIRVRPAKEDEASPVTEYFCPDGAIAKFCENAIRAFGREDIGVIDGGTIVKLYQYRIGPPSHSVDFGLDQGLTTNLLECALPIRIYDFDAERQQNKGKLRRDGIADRTFSGMRMAFSDVEDSNSIDLPTYQVAQSEENPRLGKICIYATGIKNLPQHMQNHSLRVFYTFNGQAQMKDSAGTILRRAKLDDLRNHIIVQVDCNEMNKTAKSSIFKPDRQRTSEGELSKEMKDLIVAALAEDDELRGYAKTIRERRVTETIQNDDQGKELWNLLVRNNPELKDLLGVGGVVFGDSDTGRGINNFEGKEYPTKLLLLSPDNAVLQVPVNTHRRIECETDAANDYLGRPLDKGKFFWESSLKVPHRAKLLNGKLRITVWPFNDAQVGDSIDAVFGFNDSSRTEPLKQKIKIVWAKQEPKKTKPPGKPGGSGRGKSPMHGAPDIRLVKECDWGEHGFDKESGAYCSQNEAGVTIYVNGDNQHLHVILQNERDDSVREMLTHLFKLGVGILTLSMYKKFLTKFHESDTEWDEHLKHASSAISAHVVTLIRKLGGR